MKKFYLTTFVFVIFVATCYAQDVKPFYDSPYTLRNSSTFNKNSLLLSAGVGSPNVENYSVSYNYNTPGKYSPAFYIELEHGLLSDEVGLGASVVSSWGKREGQYSEKVRETTIGISGYYHFNKLISVKRLDIYAGLGLAYRRQLTTVDPASDQSDIVTQNVLIVNHAGARYSITPKVSLHVRYTYDNRSNFIGGITFRLK